MSSKFSSQFFQKSPLYGAYASGADAVFAVSDAPHFAKLQNDTLGGVLASDKKDPCQKLEDRYSSGVITKQRYMDGLKNCAKTSKKEKETTTLDGQVLSSITKDYSDLDNKNSYYYDYGEG